MEVLLSLFSFLSSLFPSYKHTRRARDSTAVLFDGRLFWGATSDPGDLAEFDGPALTLCVYRSSETSFCTEVSVGGESRDLTFRFTLPFLPVFSFGVENVASRQLRKKVSVWAQKQAEVNRAEGRFGGSYAYELDPFEGPRCTGVSIFSGTLTFKLWQSSMGWSSDSAKVAPWKGLGWSTNYRLADIFGREKVSEVELHRETTSIEMPEGDYPCEVVLSSRESRRALLPWTSRMTRAYVEMRKAIPLPGKGENSYDCGEDAVSSMSCMTDSVIDAKLKLKESVMRDRLRRGGRYWRPEAEVASS